MSYGVVMVLNLRAMLMEQQNDGVIVTLVIHLLANLVGLSFLSNKVHVIPLVSTK